MDAAMGPFVAEVVLSCLCSGSLAPPECSLARVGLVGLVGLSSIGVRDWTCMLGKCTIGVRSLDIGSTPTEVEATWILF